MMNKKKEFRSAKSLAEGQNSPGRRHAIHHRSQSPPAAFLFPDTSDSQASRRRSYRTSMATKLNDLHG